MMNLETPDEACRAQSEQRPAKSAAAADIERLGELRLHPCERSGVRVGLARQIDDRQRPVAKRRHPLHWPVRGAAKAQPQRLRILDCPPRGELEGGDVQRSEN